jgi:hypothetical protein
MKKLLFSILSLSLMMAFPQAYATTLADSTERMPPSNSTERTPPDNVMKAPQNNSRDDDKASAIDIAKTPRSPNMKVPQNTSRDDEETSEEQPLQPCDGVPATITVEPQVQQFLDCEILKILSQPEKVESFTVEPKEDSTLPERNRLGPYPIKEQGRNLTTEELKDLQKLLFKKDSYHFGMEKRCRFKPDMGLHFVKGNEAVAILLSFSCNLCLFVYQKEDKLEDFDPVQPELLKLANSLFPAQ